LGDSDSDSEESDPIPVTRIHVLHLRMQGLTQLAPARPEFDEDRTLSNVLREADLVALKVLDFHQLGLLAQRDPQFSALLRGNASGSEGPGKKQGRAYEMWGALGETPATERVFSFHNTIPTCTK
jgi:hypothetical protein